ncbi:MAG: hypothetical protein OSJ65_05970 [Bacilli bacterium]|nr:hypothetical protein [Bacilli bacterium]
MKKIFLTFTFVFAFFSFYGNVNAINTYNQVNVKTAFEENIDLEKIEEIEIHLEDATEYSKDYILEKSNNFELTISDAPYGPYQFVYGVVIGDKIGYYNVSAEVNILNDDNSLEVLVSVTTNKNTTTNKTLTEESINRIVGSVTQTTTTKVTENDNAGIIIDDETDHDDSGLSVEEETTTTVSKDVEEARKKEKQEEKKIETRKRNSLIGKIMFSIIGVTLLIGIIYASVKILNANK